MVCVLTQLEEIWNLRPLSNLVELSMSDNPVTQLPHFRLYVVFHLRTLEILDGKPISFEERQAAHSRFGQGCCSIVIHINSFLRSFSCIVTGLYILVKEVYYCFDLLR